MPFMSDAQVSRLQQHVHSKDNQIANLKKKGKLERAGEIAFQVGEGVAAAGLVGFLRGTVEKSGKQFAVGPVDVELLMGAALVGLSAFKLFGKLDSHVLNMGCGILAHYAGQMGRAMGRGQHLTSSVIGMLPEMEPPFVGRRELSAGTFTSRDLAQALAQSAAAG